MQPHSGSRAPAIQPDIALRRLNGNQALFATLAGFFLEDAPAVFDALMEGVRDASIGSAVQNAHRLRGLASSFEARPVMDLCQEIEDLKGTEQTKALSGLGAQLETEFARLMDSLRTVTN